MHVIPKSGARPAARGGAYRVVRNAAGDAAEIYLYGPIGSAGFWGDGSEITAARFQADLKSLGAVKKITCRINSEGGDVFDGKTIYTLLVQHVAKVTCCVDGLAASAASFIAMAGDQIDMAEGAFMMIHNAWSMSAGNATDMRKCADLLDMVDASMVDVYAARTKCSADEIRMMMADETWMAAAAALDKGFCDAVTPNKAVAAAVRDATKYRHLPAAFRPRRAAAMARVEQMAVVNR